MKKSKCEYFWDRNQDEKIFVDYAHNALGELCRFVYNKRTKQYEFIPIPLKNVKETRKYLEEILDEQQKE